MPTPRLRRAVPLTLAGLVLAAPTAGAQAVSLLAPDARVRIWSAPEVLRLDGWFVALDTTGAGALVVRRPVRAGPDEPVRDIRDTVPLSMVHRLDVYRQHPRGRRGGRRSLIGGAIGVAGGALLGAATDASDCEEWCGAAPVVLGAIGGLTGALIGGLTGSQPVAGWETVQVPRRVGIMPVRRGLAFSVRF